jgi:hypothetical protein
MKADPKAGRAEALRRAASSNCFSSIDLEAVQPVAVLVHAKAQPAADRLTPLVFGLDVTQRANLENVGIVPPLAQRRMGEDDLTGITNRKLRRQSARQFGSRSRQLIRNSAARARPRRRDW